MESVELPGFSQLRGNFENREAIYVEKGALKVRVSGIQVFERFVSAQIEEIETLGLGVGAYYHGGSKRDTPLRWDIGVGPPVWFSDHCWKGGYGGWTLYFDPELVQRVTELAATLSGSKNPLAGYSEILDLLETGSRLKRQRWQSVFPDT